MDAVPLRKLTRLVADWKVYLTTQQAYSTIHVEKSAAAADEWLEWAGRHGWNTPSAMRWSQSLIKAGARKTAQNKVSQAREFCRYLTLVQAVTSNPMEGVRVSNGRRDRQRQWQPFELSEVCKLIDAAEARESSSDRRRSKNGPLASTFYALLTLTGLRYTEARMQLWSDIDLGRGSMVVTADKAQRQDCIPLCTEAISVLKAWKKWSLGERIFPQVPSAHTLKDDMRAVGIATAEDGGKKGEWHRFRKTAITERAAAGADVRNLHHFARHDNIQTTLSLYDRVRVEEMRGVAALMPKLNGFLKRERLGISSAPRGNIKKSGDLALTNGRLVSEDVGVQAECGEVPKAPLHHDERDPRCTSAAPEHPAVKRRVGRSRSDVAVAPVNGAVGNWTHGSNGGDREDRILAIIERLLGI